MSSPRCMLLAVKTERISLRLDGTIAICKKMGKELLLSGARGCLFGAGTGLFLFLRLGFPKNASLAIYLSRLFIIAGLKFGLFLWLLRSLLLPLARHLQDPNRSADSQDGVLHKLAAAKPSSANGVYPTKCGASLVVLPAPANDAPLGTKSTPNS